MLPLTLKHSKGKGIRFIGVYPPECSYDLPRLVVSCISPYTISYGHNPFHSRINAPPVLPLQSKTKTPTEKQYAFCLDSRGIHQRLTVAEIEDKTYKQPVRVDS